MIPIRWNFLALGCAALLLGAPGRADTLQRFQATYSWRWHSMTVAVTTLRLEQQQDHWLYRSTSEPRGIGRVFSERPVQESTLQISADGVRPLRFDSDDGTSSTKRDAHVVFDWEHGRATGVYEDVPVNLPLSHGAQDDLSVQVALMNDLLAGRMPTTFYLIDKNSLREYQYTREGEAVLDTAIGREQTVIFASQKKGSPRITRFWCAPAQGFIPVRIEQTRGSEVQWSMQIESLKRG